MKKYLIITLCVILSSCEKEPKKTIQNGNFKIDFLFENDGCKVYRFRDGGRNIYYSNCAGKMNYDVERNSGKTSYTDRGETTTN